MTRRAPARLVLVLLVLLLMPTAAVCVGAEAPSREVGGPEYRTLDGYRTYDEVFAELQSLAQAHPEIVSLMDLGAVYPNTDGSPKTTWRGNRIWGIKVSDDVHVNESDEPKLLYTGCHHAREWITIEMVMYAANRIITQYGNNASITTIVNSRELWFVPIVNPDGFIYTQEEQWPVAPNEQGSLWRKNFRDNGDGTFGVDINRNYGFAWGYNNQGSSQFPADETYRGPAPFSEPETQIIRDLGEAIGFSGAISFHSFSNLIIFPWSYKAVHAPEYPLYKELGRRFSAFNGYDYGDARDDILYETNGDFTDWFFANTSALAFTFEIGPAPIFIPEEANILPYCQENYEPMLILARYANDWYGMFQSGIRCTVQDPRGNPIAGAEVNVSLLGDDRLHFTTGADGTFSFKAPRDVAYRIVVTYPGYSEGNETFEPEWQNQLTDVNITIRDIVPPVISRVIASHQGEQGTTFGIGEAVRIDVQESSNETGLAGTVTIQSILGNYYHRRKPLTYDPGSRSYYYVWDTSGREPRTDYIVTTELWDIDGNKDADGVHVGVPDLTLELRDITPPATPGGLAVQAPAEGGRLRVTWARNADDTVNYTLQRRAGTGGEWTTLIDLKVDVTEFLDQGLDNGQTYFYRIMAWDRVPLPSSWSALVSGIPSDTVPPGPVMSLHVTAPSEGGRLELAWLESGDDTATYVLMRDDGGNYSEVARLPRGTTFYVDTDVEDKQTYMYKIMALDLALNEGPLSDAVIGVPQDVVPPKMPSPGPLPTLTNSVELRVNGTAEPGSVVDVQVNGQVVSGDAGLQVDGGGNWSGTVMLVPKENRLRFRARDTAGNPSGLTPEALIFVDVTVPVIEFQFPVPQQKAVRLDPVIDVRFSEALVSSTVTARMLLEGGQPVGSTFTYDEEAHTLRIVPSEGLDRGTVYQVVIEGSDKAGNALEGGAFSFSTVEPEHEASGVGTALLVAVLLLVVVAVVAVLLLQRRRRRAAALQRQSAQAQAAGPTPGWAGDGQPPEAPPARKPDWEEY